MVTDEITRYLEEPPDRELPDWMQEAIQEARQVEEGYGTRYITIPQADTHEDYRNVERFISTVRSRHLQDRLWRAIQGRGASRYFKDVLAEHPAERDRWFAFKDRCVYDRISWWLESEGIEPTNPIEPPEGPAPEAEEEASREAVMEELTLFLIYLCSWEEYPAPGFTTRRAWEGYLFEVPDALEERGYISQTSRAKSVTLTGEACDGHRSSRRATRFEATGGLLRHKEFRCATRTQVGSISRKL